MGLSAGETEKKKKSSATNTVSPIDTKIERGETTNYITKYQRAKQKK